MSLRDARKLAAGLPGWRLVSGKALRRDHVLRDFVSAVAFLRAVARVAEAAGHHPDLHLTGYRKLAVVLTTHDAGGLTKDDFALAAKIDALPRRTLGPLKLSS